MKVRYIGIVRTNPAPVIELCVEQHVADLNYFTRGTIKEFMSFMGKKVAERTQLNVHNVVTDGDKDATIHALGSDGFCAVVITDNEYPVHVVKGLCRKIAYDFKVKYPPSAWASATKDTPLLSMPEFPELIKKYQNPEEADNIVKIQKELDETKTVLHKTIESVLERGEKIDNLVAKSDDLSAQSKMFYTQAKKQNSCCIVM